MEHENIFGFSAVPLFALTSTSAEILSSFGFGLSSDLVDALLCVWAPFILASSLIFFGDWGELAFLLSTPLNSARAFSFACTFFT